MRVDDDDDDIEVLRRLIDNEYVRHRVKFVYEGHRVMVKVTKAKKGRKFLFPQTSVAHKSGSRKDRAIGFECTMGFMTTANRMV